MRRKAAEELAAAYRLQVGELKRIRQERELEALKLVRAERPGEQTFHVSQRAAELQCHLRNT